MRPRRSKPCVDGLIAAIIRSVEDLLTALIALSPPADRRLNAAMRQTCAETLGLAPLPYEEVYGPVSDAEPLVAPVDDGIHGVRLANAIHLSGWVGEEVSITDFDEQRYLSELNKRIADEGQFPLREEG